MSGMSLSYGGVEGGWGGQAVVSAALESYWMFFFTATFQNMAIPLNANTKQVLRVTGPNSDIANFPSVKNK